MSRSWGIILLALFLIIFGVLAITNIQVQFAEFIEGGLAIASAICLLLGK
jgi:hypothetical protein